MLKSKPRDDRFPDHIISQTGIHTPKSGVLFRQLLASGLPQSDRLSNHTYELSTHIEVLARLFIPFLVPSLVLIKDNTLGKACIGNIFQYIKPIIIIASNKEIIQPYTSLRTWPKALASFQSFKTILRINLCDA